MKKSSHLLSCWCFDDTLWWLRQK